MGAASIASSNSNSEVFLSNAIENNLLTPNHLSKVFSRKTQPVGEPAQIQKERKYAWIKDLWSGFSKAVIKAYHIAVKVLLSPLSFMRYCLKTFLKSVIDKSFFSGYGMKESVKAKRREELKAGIRHGKKGETHISPHKAEQLVFKSKNIDALYIKSAASEEKRTGNVIIYVLAKDYQNFNPNNFDHLLDDGADVVLFNPTVKDAETMAADLKTVIHNLREKNPEQKLLLHSYCIGAHVATSVASDLAENENDTLPVIVDRGYGDGFEIAKKVTCLAKIPLAKRYINTHYNSKTLEKIEKHRGRMMFLSAKDGKDQLTHRRMKGRVKNFTKDLAEKHNNKEDSFIEFAGSADHWTPWTYEVHNQAKEFMSQLGIINKGYTKFDEKNTGGFPKKTTVPWARRHLVPIFV